MKTVIIGNGVAGATAARHLRKLTDHEIVMISEETEHPYARTALMYIFMGHVRYTDTKLKEDVFWQKNRIELVKGRVYSIQSKEKYIVLADGQKLDYDYLIIASGSSSKKLSIPGYSLSGVHSLYNIHDLENIEKTLSLSCSNVVVAGGGLIGVELAEMFASRGLQVHFIIREKGFWNAVLTPEEQNIVHHHLQAHGVQMYFEKEIKEIKGSTRVQEVVLFDGNVIPADLVAVAVGVEPNIDFVRQSEISFAKGIIVDDYLATNVPQIYAIGDCAELRIPQPGRRKLEPVWYTAKLMGEVAASNISGQIKKYEPGIWYNSAKFFDVEYQCYGQTFPVGRGDGFESFFWRHEKQAKSLRIFYNSEGRVLGFSALGIRLRQSVCEQWIMDKATIVDVVKNIKMCFFDPEFFRTFEKEIQESFIKKIRPSSAVAE